MENQLIREQVFDVLFNYVKIADGIFTESDCATVRDEICLRIDQSQFTADEAEDYINQEVEKRIAERMPSEEEMLQMVAGHIPWLIASARNSKKYVNPFTSGHAFSEVIRILSENLSRELRSRMSEPNKEGR